ncbi:MAG: TRAP transporter permease DctQ [Rhodocyclaceae bacterium]|jgi:TRAP-type C4-dicarboxylate transport system permease small subunit|nr:TRAP transporter permease DctQ [Rhodocyclaceae bacterium]
MSALLDRMFTWAGWLAGLSMIATLAAVMASIFGRLLHFDVPGADAYAGYCMAASAFLALAHTLRRGEHIRVTLILNHLGVKARHALEIFCHGAALFLSGALAWYSLRLVWQSWQFHDISTGLDATPLWIPQIGMAAGTVLFFLAFAQDLLDLLRGKSLPEVREGGEPAHIE